MKNNLNLLFIHGNQLYAERIVELLSTYYNKVTLGFLDDKDELERSLRKKWDILVYGKAYDLSVNDIQQLVKDKELDLPLISLLNDKVRKVDLTDEGMPSKINSVITRSVNPNNEVEVVLSIVLQHQALLERREIKSLRHIIDEAEQRANILIKNSKSAVAYIDQGIHVFANEPYLELFNFESMDDLMGLPVIDLISGGEDIKEFKQFLRKFIKGNRDKVEFEFESKRKDGSTFAAKLQLASATYEGQPVNQVIIQHNRGGVNAEEIAAKLAEVERQDSLTGLENRKGLQSRLPKFFDIAKSGSSVLGFMYIRIDNLSEINSLIGIDAVDATVKQVSISLKKDLEGSYICRFSDNIFVAIVSSANDVLMQQKAQQVIKSVDDLLIEVGKRSVTSTVSIGMVLMDEHSPSIDAIMKRSIDSHNKVLEKTENQGNDYHLYDPSEFASSDDKALAEYLAGAIANNKFQLYYQPIYDIKNDSSDKFEVTVRLNMSDDRVMSYGEFAQVAEDHNLTATIDKWMLITASKQLSQVKAQHPNASIIIRLSGATLIDEQLPHVTAQLIKALGGDVNALTLQFSEASILDYMAVAKEQFTKLASLNAQTSISDFGSTDKAIEVLDYLKPSMVKLSRDYVKDLSTEDNLNSIKELISTTSEREICTLMPFIEDAATMSVSWGVGARYLQGNYLQEPTSEMTFG